MDSLGSPISDHPFQPEMLKKLATTSMPFGRYQGRLIIDLPEPYLLWFAKKEAFPNGQLGELMKIALELHIHGLTGLIKPLKNPTDDSDQNS